MITNMMNIFLSLVSTARFYNDKRVLDYQQITIINKDTIFDIENDADVMHTPKMMATVLCCQINQYVQAIEYEPNKLITHLISNLKSKHNLDANHDAIFSLFLFRGSVSHISINSNTNLSNFDWTQKLLFLILYYAYDFLYDVKIIMPYTYAKCERTFGYKLFPAFMSILMSQEYYLAGDSFLKLIQDQCIKLKLTLKEFTAIEAYNLSPSKYVFISVIKIFIAKLVEIIFVAAEDKNQIVSNQNNVIDQDDLLKLLKKTIKEYPKFRVFWKNSRKSTCLNKYAYINVQNISHIILVFENLLKNIKISIESGTIFLFNIDITKIIIDYITFSTNMFVAKQTNLSKKIILEIFGFLYGAQNEIDDLVTVLIEIENKFLAFMKNNMKSSDKESYLIFSILNIKEDFDIGEKCNQVFVQYRAQFLEDYMFKEKFIEIVTMFSNQFAKTITNAFKSIDDTVCSYLEISKSDYTEESNKISNNVLEELTNKKIILKKPDKTLASFYKVILKDQQSWYEHHKNTLEKNKKNTIDKLYMYFIRLKYKHKVGIDNNNNKKYKYVIDMRI